MSPTHQNILKNKNVLSTTVKNTNGTQHSQLFHASTSSPTVGVEGPRRMSNVFLNQSNMKRYKQNRDLLSERREKRTQKLRTF